MKRLHPASRSLLPPYPPPSSHPCLCLPHQSTSSAHPSHVSWPHKELHRRPKWPRSHGTTASVSAHPSHGSWPHRELHRRPKWLRSHGTTAPISAHPSHVPWPQRELHRRPMWLRSHGTTAPISAHPSRGSWPHREIHRRRQWQGSHGGLWQFRHTSHEDRGPIGSATEGASGRVRMAASGHFGTPLTRIVAP